MKRVQRHVTVLAGLAAILVAACETSGSRPTDAGGDLNDVQHDLDAAMNGVSGDGVAAWNAAIKRSAPQLAAAAGRCDPTKIANNELRVHCLAIQATAYLTLAELPERPEGLEQDPVILANRAVSSGEIICAEITGPSRFCDVLDMWSKTIETGKAARDFHALAQTASIDPAMASQRLAAFEGAARENWQGLLTIGGSDASAAQAAESRRRTVTNQACMLLWASPKVRANLSPKTNTILEDYGVAVGKALRTAATAAPFPPRSAEACASDASSQACADNRYVALEYTCGPSPHAP